MSAHNSDWVARIFDALNTGQFEPLLEELGEFEMDWSNSIGPLSGVYRGSEQLTEMRDVFIDAWEPATATWEAEEIVNLDHQRLVVASRFRGVGRGSGAEVDARGGQLWTFERGRPTRVKLFQSKAEALEAAGTGEGAGRER